MVLKEFEKRGVPEKVRRKIYNLERNEILEPGEDAIQKQKEKGAENPIEAALQEKFSVSSVEELSNVEDVRHQTSITNNADRIVKELVVTDLDGKKLFDVEKEFRMVRAADQMEVKEYHGVSTLEEKVELIAERVGLASRHEDNSPLDPAELERIRNQ